MTAHRLTETQFVSCPTCGSPVKVNTADEGTSSYEPMTDEEILARWRSGELFVRTGRIIHGDADAS